jgi:hypothetical protein
MEPTEDSGPDDGQLATDIKNVAHPLAEVGGLYQDQLRLMPAEATPEMVAASGLDIATAQAAWRAMRAAAPVARVPATLAPVRDACNLTERKTNDILTRGYRKAGYVLVNERGEFCISAQSAVRWLPGLHYWRLMHEQDGTLFSCKWSEQPFGSVQAPDHRTMFERWERTTYSHCDSDDKTYRAWRAGTVHGIEQATRGARIEYAQVGRLTVPDNGSCRLEVAATDPQVAPGTYEVFAQLPTLAPND